MTLCRSRTVFGGPARRATRVSLVVASVVAVGCASTPAPLAEVEDAPPARAAEDASSASGGPPLALRFVESRIDAAGGRTLVVPVEFAGGGPPPAAPPRVELGDGRTLPARLVWLGVEDPSPRSDVGVTASSVWLPPGPRWASAGTDAPAAERPTPGFWGVVFDPPADAAGQQVRIEGRPAPIRWLAPPPSIIGSAVRLPPRPDPSPLRADLLDALRAHAASPATRWRLTLLVERLRLYGMADAPAPAPLDDPAVEALAAQTEMRWRVALHRLARSDPRLAVRVLEALTAIIAFPEGRQMPAWPGEASGLGNLLDDLLDPTLTPGERIDRAGDWLGRLPDARVWVLDDAGRPLSEPDTLVTLEAARRRPGRVLGSVNAPGRPRGPEVVIDGFSSERLVCVAPRRPSGAVVRASVGPRAHEVAAATGGVPVRAPGLTIGPLLAPWTMSDWLDDTPVVASPPAGALLQPDFPTRAWRLYIECQFRRAPGEGDAEDIVRVRLGPAAEPHAVLRVDQRGFYVDETNPFADPVSLEVLRHQDRWAVNVPIPKGAIEPDGTMLIALERVRGDGRRSVWPRPIMPWRDQIGRARVDLTTWGRLSERE